MYECLCHWLRLNRKSEDVHLKRTNERHKGRVWKKKKEIDCLDKLYDAVRQQQQAERTTYYTTLHYKNTYYEMNREWSVSVIVMLFI